jgi:hypothetical protein
MICAGNVSCGIVTQHFWAVYLRKEGKLLEQTRLFSGASKVIMDRKNVCVRDGNVEVNITLGDGDALEVATQVGNAYTWTRKFCGITAIGTVAVDGKTYNVNAIALIDENAGYHPRNTKWYWSGGYGKDTLGRNVSWSVITGLNDGKINSERTIWIDGVPTEVAPVQFAKDLSSVSFEDGSTLHFEAEKIRERSENLLVIKSNYRQPFGTFSGQLTKDITLTEGYGVMEYHEALW